MMLSGAQEAVAALRGVLERITGALFVIGTRPGEAATMKVVNNLLAAANLAAAAEALAIARRAGLDVAQAAQVIGASSGASWITGDRLPRALAGDLAPRAATRVLHKDVGLAEDLATELGIPGELAHAAHEAFARALAAGYAEDDDAAMFVAAARRAGLDWP
jgi:3-hydroxyisobutyrate dehydrogenase-like beta-hydroxyacid dehydrogenase